MEHAVEPREHLVRHLGHGAASWWYNRSNCPRSVAMDKAVQRSRCDMADVRQHTRYSQVSMLRLCARDDDACWGASCSSRHIKCRELGQRGLPGTCHHVEQTTSSSILEYITTTSPFIHVRIPSRDNDEVSWLICSPQGAARRQRPGWSLRADRIMECRNLIRKRWLKGLPWSFLSLHPS